MLQNPCKALGFKKNMVYKIPPGGGGGVNHIQPVAYFMRMSSGLEKLLPYHCLNINVFGAMHFNIL